MSKCPKCSSDSLKDIGFAILCTKCGFTAYKKNYLETSNNNILINIGIILYFIPIFVLSFIMLAFSFFVFDEILNVTFEPFKIYLNYGGISIYMAEKILVYFFISLAIIDLYGLALSRAVAPESKKISIKDYLERLLVFSVIIILLESFSKLFFHNEDPNLTMLYIGLSIILISIGIWKILSIKAESIRDRLSDES